MPAVAPRASVHRSRASEGTRASEGSRAARNAARRLDGALRVGGLAALLWPLTLTLSPRWVIGPLLAAVVTWSVLRARAELADPGARARLDRALDLVIVADGLLLVQIVLPGHPAFSVPWTAALALGAAVRATGALRQEALGRGLGTVTASLGRARSVLVATLLPVFLVLAWGPFALHRREGAGGGLPVAGTWYVADRGWVLLLGVVVILLGAGLAGVTVGGHRFRIALRRAGSGRIRRSPDATPEHT